MSSSKAPAVVEEGQVAPEGEARRNVFDASPAAEAAKPSPQRRQSRTKETPRGKEDGVSKMSELFIPAGFRPLLLGLEGEDPITDKDTFGPDAFCSRFLWAERKRSLWGQPPNDMTVIDIAGDGTKTDLGQVSFGKVDSILRLPLPQGSGACRVIIGAPELGRMDREFVIRAVNLAGETIAGGKPDEAFGQSHFQSRINPGPDLARLRDLWSMKEVAWKPLTIFVPTVRSPIDNRDTVFDQLEIRIQLAGRDVAHLRYNLIVVQTIPLEGDRFLFVCGLPSRKCRDDPGLQSATDLAELKRLAGDVSLSDEQIFAILSRDRERSCREFFEAILSSGNSATKLAKAGGGAERLCQLLLLDVFRAASEQWTRFQREIMAIQMSADVPMAGDAEKFLKGERSNSDVWAELATAAEEVKGAAEHLLQWLLFEDGGLDCPVTDENRWLKRTSLSLQADLEYSRVAMERSLEMSLRRLAGASEFVKEAESKNLARLTVVAAVFLPLGFGADLLGMQFRVGELGLILYDYLGLVISSGLVIFLVHKVVPLLRLIAGMFSMPEKGQAGTRRNSRVNIARGFFRATWLLIVTPLWAIFVASFLLGMTGDMPRSLAVLKYGCIAWSVLFVVYLATVLVGVWVTGKMWDLFGWNLV